jgi:adenylate cyclase class 2
MYEVEMKLRTAHDPVCERLAETDADHVETVTQEDTYFDAPDRDFAATDEALRVRRETADETRVCLTYKGPLVGDATKTRTETETRVADGDAIRAILDGLGYTPAATVTKTRERYALADCTVTLDTVERLGEFVEVEYTREVTADERERAEQAVVAVLDTLGLDPEAEIRTSYLGLLLEPS